MGTPVACTYAMLSFGHYENTKILPEFNSNLYYYRHYIDDVLGIWIPDQHSNEARWEHFTATLNWGSLWWKVQDPSLQVQFLDLSIQKGTTGISFETFQKPMNLYLYIPPLSVHPSSCFKGLIFGKIRRYWTQNNPRKFQEILLNFIWRLLDRGHSL
jgi:hypothetical protein